MDGRGGCCIARYAAGGSGGASYEMSKIDRIMLRYRPIAPKPAEGPASASGVKVGDKPPHAKTGRGRKKGSNGSNTNNNNNNKLKCNNRGGGGGRKRKLSAVTEEENHMKCSGRQVSTSDGLVAVAAPREHTSVVTLPFLPETPDLTVQTKNHVGGGVRKVISPVWLSFNGKNSLEVSSHHSGTDIRSNGRWFGNGEKTTVEVANVPPVYHEKAPRHRAMVGSWVIVDCVTETWGDVNVNGSTDETRVLERSDEEKMRSLDEDSCPSFISDSWNKVWWTNKAYKDMVTSPRNIDDDEEEEEEEDVMVWVVTRESLPVGCRGFTCRVRCHHRSGGGKDNSNSVAAAAAGVVGTSSTVPCDAWRMESGGYAWRLDVKAALSLGR